MSSIKLNVTGVCENCKEFDPKIEITSPFFDQSGKFVEMQYKTWCGHEKVCYKLREEGGPECSWKN